MTKEQFFIYFLVGIMVFSAIGTGILLITANNNDTNSTVQTEDLTDTQSDVEVKIAGGAADVDRYLPDGNVTQLETTDLETGDGTTAQAGDTITFHYTGWLASDGTVFDSSVDRGSPATFPLGNVIQGWQEGIPGMKVGGVRRLVIPAELAYGETGSGSSIPPNSALVFEVQLIDVVQ